MPRFERNMQEANCAIEGCQKEAFTLESKEATRGSCLVPAGLVGTSCTQKRSYGSIEGCMQPTITLWIKTIMERSNVQTKKESKQPLHCESCEARDAIEGGMQESPTL